MVNRTRVRFFLYVDNYGICWLLVGIYIYRSVGRTHELQLVTIRAVYEAKLSRIGAATHKAETYAIVMTMLKMMMTSTVTAECLRYRKSQSGDVRRINKRICRTSADMMCGRPPIAIYAHIHCISKSINFETV